MKTQLNVRIPAMTERQIAALSKQTGMTYTQLLIVAIDRLYLSQMKEKPMTMTLKQALESLLDAPRLLDDGATDWDAQNLLESYEQSDDPTVLEKEVILNERGIFALDQNGYIASVPLFSFR